MEFATDLTDLLSNLHSKRLSAQAQMQRCLELAHSASNQSVFASVRSDALEQAARVSSQMLKQRSDSTLQVLKQRSDSTLQVLKQRSDSTLQLPLAGVALSVKDLFDVAGERSASSSRVLQTRPLATQDCPAVARLRAAGGVVIGRTHMSELAFSGMGVNPHFGTPINPQAMQVTGEQRIPGGSSSGAAVSVATGSAWIGIGSDTGGSLRIPAALCGLVGFKPTQAAVPTRGANPLSYTMDSIGAITHSVRDAALVHGILSQSPVQLAPPALSALTFGVPTTLMLEGLDDANRRNFESSLERLQEAGAKIERIELSELAELSVLQARGGFSACEVQSWLQTQGIWPERRHEIDPRVAQRIATADTMSAADYVRLQHARRLWIARTENRIAPFDALLSPTTPIVAPLIADVAPGGERDAEFFRCNGLMLRNTLPVNFFDGCAISIPNHAADQLATGLMLWHQHGRDHRVLAIAASVEALFARS
jgi:aspartyl-tRNA(Asn)/glutamyl-tRNA(Gln) amidotransferase subunit A